MFNKLSFAIIEIISFLTEFSLIKFTNVINLSFFMGTLKSMCCATKSSTIEKHFQTTVILYSKITSEP